MEDMRGPWGGNVPSPDNQEDYSSDQPNEEEPWAIVSSRKKGRKKPIFKNGSISNMES
jgi:hypothetical protein